jgi:hypothetical protein
MGNTETLCAICDPTSSPTFHTHKVLDLQNATSKIAHALFDSDGQPLTFPRLQEQEACFLAPRACMQHLIQCSRCRCRCRRCRRRRRRRRTCKTLSLFQSPNESGFWSRATQCCASSESTRAWGLPSLPAKLLKLPGYLSQAASSDSGPHLRTNRMSLH